MANNPMMAGLPAAHPGEILKEIILPGYDRPVAEVARRLGVARLTLINVLEGKSAVSPGMALRLARLFGNDAEYWLRLQAAHDLRLEAERLAEDLAAIEPWKPGEAA